MRFLGNVLWAIFGGLFLAIAWYICGIIFCITIVGIPFGIQCFKFGNFILLPFGKDVIYNNHTVSFFANILWIISFGLSICLISVFIGIGLCITIVGIPFGIQYFKFAKLALMPFGVEVLYKS